MSQEEARANLSVDILDHFSNCDEAVIEFLKFLKSMLLSEQIKNLIFFKL